MKIKLFVAIWMVTYNHEDYIAKAVDSVMMQNTKFKYKLFIGEDCSKDKTREICIKLKKKYPDKIELLLQDKNIGDFKNAQFIYKLCFESGAKYVAMCEGDDYWSNPFKLQKQVDFLEKNKNYNICVHNTDLLKDKELFEKEWRWDPKRTTFTAIDYIFALFFHTSSAVFRVGERKNYIFDSSIIQGDMDIFLSSINDKKVFFLEESMSVYRMHYGGITNSPKNRSPVLKYKSWITILEKFDSLTNYKFRYVIWLKKQTLKSLIFSSDKIKKEEIIFFVRIRYYFFKILLLAFVKIKSILNRD